ncbi:CapA family protein [Roseateles chitinivorans]|uniref:CapA family protein n=1 Tax=Roseateles chitinivorans TaxID=2917965 RepID=UPI003D6693B8
MTTTRITFAGDVMLSRLVGGALRRAAGGPTPWQPLAPKEELGVLVGNFEGAIGEPGDCPPGQSLCFATEAAWLATARAAGFDVLGHENNHAGDTGPDGRRRTREAIAQAGMTPLSFDDGPAFLTIGGRTLAIVSLSRLASADRDPQRFDVALEQQMATARQLADAVVVYVHWGTELAGWPSRAQYEDAARLQALGADVIVGHHPHVVQPPECIEGRPVFFSLGNHVFDQKYAEAKSGLLAQCGWTDAGGLSCTGLRTAMANGGFFPQLTGARLPVCAAPPRARLTIAGTAISAGAWRVVDGSVRQTLRFRPAQGAAFEAVVGRVRRAQPMSLDRIQAEAPGHAGTGLLLIEDRYSNLDRRVAPRPYVYAVDPPTPQGGPGRLRALWRGSALAYPLIDAVVMPSSSPAGGEFLCALHEASSFLAGPVITDPASPAAPLTLAYRWNGFGFSRAPAPSDQDDCAARYRDVTQR